MILPHDHQTPARKQAIKSWHEWCDRLADQEAYRASKEDDVDAAAWLIAVAVAVLFVTTVYVSITGGTQ